MSEVVLLDGSVGQELVKRAGKKPTPLWSTTVMMEHPEMAREVHSAYFRAGATIASTNTYTMLRDRLAREGLQEQLPALWAQAVKAARDARQENGGGRVAGVLGPLMASYRPDICPPPEEAEVLYGDIVAALSPNVDLLLIETMSSVAQAEGALRAAKKPGVPVWIAATVDDFDGDKLRSGENLADLAPTLHQYNADAVLINCSRPEAVTTAVGIIAEFGLPFGGYANGFERITEGFLEDAPTVAALRERNDLTPPVYADFAMDWISKGATIVGGCCEIGTEHITELASRIAAAGFRMV